MSAHTLPPPRRPSHALTGLWQPARPAVIVPPPMRREPSPEPRAWKPGDVVIPALCEDDGDLPTIASQLDHEPDGAL